jgi:Putative lactococcus lactis phage r1t holin
VIFTKLFWADAAERAAKTAAQVCLLVLGQDIAGLDVFGVSWENVAGFAFGGALISVLTSIASAGTEGVSPASLVDRKD